MSDPSDWRDHAGIGAFVMGVLWAVRELLPRFLRNGDEPAQKRITPADVREEVLRLGGKMDALSLRFDSFQSEEIRIHARIEQELRDTLDHHNRRD